MHNTTDATHHTSRCAQRARRADISAPRLKILPLSLSLALAAAGMFGGTAHAAVAVGIATGGGSITPLTLPTGGTVVGGVGSISQSGASTVINQLSNKLALDWQTFNVGKDATVLFNQPSTHAVALNRIFDQNASQIFGHINANGQVFLINTNGIIFGSTAKVNVGGLVASTLDLTPKDFLADHYNLSARGGSAGVVNHGTIQAASGGSVSLVGGSVANDGLIVANYGRINLDGADHAVLDFDGNGLINIQVTGELKQRLDANAAVSNSGTLQSEAGTVVLQASAAKDLFTQLVNNSGVITAGGISSDGGVVRLVGSGGNVENSGNIDASGQHGGSIRLVSDKDVLVTGGSLDASGSLGGGTVLVGGDAHGANAQVQNADRTYFASNAVINADAITAGDGGRVIVWSDNITRADGTISARGGANGGDGGFVETSGKHTLDFTANVDTSAPNGKRGTLLLDPDDITIMHGIAGDSTTLVSGTSPFSNTGTGILTDGTLNTQLGTSNVVVTTSGDGISSNNDVMVNLNGNSLTLDSNTYIHLGGTYAGAGALKLLFKDTLDLATNVPTFTGSLSVTATGNGASTILASGQLWALSGVNQGYLAPLGVSFSGVDTLNDATGTISFGPSGSVTGDVTAKVLDYTSSTRALTFDPSTGTFLNSGIGGFYGGVSTIYGSPGQINTITGSGGTYALNNNVADSGSSGVYNWTSFRNINDATGTVNFGTNGGLSGSLVAQTLDFSSYVQNLQLNVTSGVLSNSAVGGTVNGFNVIDANPAQINTVVGTGATYSLDDSVADAGKSTVFTWSGFKNITDTNGTINFGTAGSVSGSLTVRELDYSSYGSPVLFNLSNASSGATTGIDGVWNGVSAVVGSAGNDTIRGSGQTYSLSGLNAGSSGSVGWTGFEKLSDSGAGNFVFADGSSISGTVTAVGGTLNYSAYSTAVNVALGGSATGTGGWSGISTIIGGQASDTMNGNSQTYTLSGANAGSNGTVSWSGLENINDASGTVEFGVNGSVSGDVNAPTLNYSIYGGPVTFDLAGGNNTTTGIGGSWSNVATVTGSAAQVNILKGTGQTYTLANGTQDAGSNGAQSWTFFGTINDATGTVKFGTSGSVGGNLTAQTLDYANYGAPMTFDLSNGIGATTGIGGTWSSVTTVAGSGNADTITGSNQTYALSGANAGTNGTVSWSSFENLLDSGNGTLSAANQTWTLTGSDQGSVTDLTGSFSGIGNLTDTGAGRFYMHSGADGTISGNLDAGSNGSLDYTGYSTPVNVNLSGAGTTGVAGTVSGVASIAANSNLGVSGLTVGDLDITTSGAGTTTTLGAISVGTNLTIQASGSIQQTGALTVAGTSAISAAGNLITLDDANNDFGGLVDLTGGTTVIIDQGALTLGTLSTGDLTATSGGTLNLGQGSIGGNLLASSAGALSQAGGLQVSGSSNLQAGAGAITLTDASNHFTGAVTAAGHGVSLVDAGNLTIAALNSGLDRTVNLSAGGALMLPLSGIDTGTADLNLRANGGFIVTPGMLSGGNITLAGRDGVTLNNDLYTIGMVSLSSSLGAIDQIGGSVTAGMLTGSSAGDTTLNGANAIDTLGGFNAANFRLTNTKTLAVSGPLSVSGLLGLTTTAGTLTINGALSANVLDLSSADSLNLSQNLQATTLNLQSGSNISQTGGVMSVGTLTGSSMGDTLLNGANQVDTLGNFSAANFSLSNANALAVNGTITVPGTVSLITTSGALAINTDLFSNAVSLTAATDLDLAHNVTAQSIALHSTGGNISQSSGVLSAPALTGSSTGSTTLNGANQLDALDSFNAANFSLTNARALAVNGPLSVPGSLSLITTSGSLTLNTDLAASALSLSAATDLNLVRNLNAQTLALQSTGGNITQTGGVLTASTLTGNSSGDTTLNGANKLDTVASFSAGNFSLTNAKALVINGPLSVPGNLTLTTTSGALTLNSDLSATALSLSAATDLDLLKNLSAQTVSLHSAGNISQNGGVLTAATLTGSSTGSTSLNGANQLTTLGSFSAANLSLSNARTLAVDGPLVVPGSLILTTTSGALTINTDLSANTVNLSAATDLGLGYNINAQTVVLHSAGNISQSGGVLTAATLTGSSGGDSHLDRANRIDTLGSFSAANFSLSNAKTLNVSGPLTVPGSVSLTTTAGALVVSGDLSANAVSLTSASDLALAHNVSATTLALASGGRITQTGGVLTAGMLSGTSVGDTTLNGANQLATLGSFSAANFSLTNAKTLAVNGPLSVPGSLSLTTTSGALTINTDLSAHTLTLSAAADLGLTHNLNAQSLALSSGGNISQSGGVLTAATLTGSSAGDTHLDGANQLDTLGSFSAANFSLVNAKTLNVTGPLTVPGNLSVTTTAGALVLTGDLSANAVSLNSANDLLLAYNVNATTLTLTSAGDIRQTGGVLSAATLTGNSTGDTSLNGANQLDMLGSFHAANFSLTNAKALAVNGPVTVPGNLSLTTTSGALTINTDLSATTLTLAAATDLQLTHNLSAQTLALNSAGNITQAGGVLTAATLTGSSIGDTSLDGANQVDTLGSFSAANFSLTNAKTLTVIGPLNVSGNLDLTTTSGALILNTDLSGNTLTLDSATDLDLAHDIHAQTLSLHSAGNISQSGGVLTAVTLTGSSAGDTTLNGANQLDTLGSFSAANFSLSNAKTLAVSGPLTVPGSLLLRTTAGALVIGGDLSANEVTLDSATDLGLAHDINTTTLTLISGGNISQSGGTLAAAALAGSSTGDTSLNGANQLDTIGSFSAANFSLTNAKALAVNGPLTVLGSLSLTTTSGTLSFATDLTGDTISLTAGSDLLLTHDVHASGLVLKAGGDIRQSAGVLTAATLTGQSGGDTRLTGANQIDALNAFQAANFNLINAKALVVNGVLTTPGTLQLTTTAGSLVLNTDVTANAVTLTSAAALSLSHDINASTVSLQASGNITQSAGVLTAAMLTGSSTGDTSLVGANKIDALGSFSAANFTLTNAQSLRVTGPLTVPGAVTLTTTVGALSVDSDLSAGSITLASATDLALAKNLSAATLSVNAGGNISQFAGVLTADVLSGRSVGDTTLSGANRIDTLGGFSAANFSLVNAQALTVSGPLTVPGKLSLTTTAGALSMNTDLTAGSAILTAATDLRLASNLGAAALSFNAGGNIVQSGGALTAGLVSGQSAGDTTLTGPNLIDTLGPFNAANFTLINAKALTVTGPLTVAARLSLATTTGDLRLQGMLNGGAVWLSSNGDIIQSEGILTSAKLSGRATGMVALDQANRIDEVGDFSANSGFSLANGKAMTISGTINGGSNTRLRTTAGTLTVAAGARVLGTGIELEGHDGLALNGAINSGAGSIQLASSAGAISQASGGSLAADSLSGNSAADTTLTGDNQLVTLGNFSTGGNFSFFDARTLTVNHAINANGGQGDISLRTLGANSDLILATDLAARTATLVAGRDLMQTGSRLQALTLSGESGRDAVLTGSNEISTLGDFAAGSLSLSNARALAVGGAVTTGNGALSLITTAGQLSVSAAGSVSGGAVSLGSASDLAINGQVFAHALALSSAGAVSQSASGAITASSLSGHSTGGTVLGGANHVGSLDQFSADGFSFNNAGSLTVNGPVNGGSSTRLSTTVGDLLLNGQVSGATTTLVSAGAITEGSAGSVLANELTGSSVGSANLTSANAIDRLSAFTASGLSLTNSKSLTVTGAVVGGSSTTLTTTAGDIGIQAAVSGTRVQIQSAGMITEGSSGLITAETLSGRSGGASTFGTNALPIANQISVLGNFLSGGNFSLTNARTLTLASVDGSAFTVDSGTSAFYLSVSNGDLFQLGETPLYDGTGTFSSTGAIGTVGAPIYVVGDVPQFVAMVGAPPAYFFAVNRKGGGLPLTGELSFNLQSSPLFGKSQNGNGRGDAYIDPSVISANYRSFGIVPSGILLPEDQQQCQPELEDCPDE